jgi:outer membrane protein TolC
MFLKYFLIICIFFINFVYGEVITLDEYLEQVTTNNGIYRSHKEKMSADELKISEGGLLTSFNFIATTSYNSDSSFQLKTDGTETKDTSYFNFGIQKSIDFGTNFQFLYNVASLDVQPLNSPDSLNINVNSFSFNINQNLLKNFNGKTIKATKNVIKNTTEADFYSEEQGAKKLLNSAEKIYWGVVIAKMITHVNEESVKNNQEMYNYIFEKVKMNLMDKANEIQSNSALENSKLELQKAINNEKKIIRNFNQLRGIDDDVLNEDETLSKIPFDFLETYQHEGNYKPSSTLKSLEKQVEVIKNNKILENNKYGADLNLSFTYTTDNADKPIKYNYSDTNYYSLSLNYIVPLDRNAVNNVMEANYKNENAIKLLYRQQQKDDKIRFEELLSDLEKTQKNLKMTRNIEKLQKDKLSHEMRRWKNGVSTTYQISQFENDLTHSSLNSLSVANEILEIIADLKM